MQIRDLQENEREEDVGQGERLVGAKRNSPSNRDSATRQGGWGTQGGPSMGMPSLKSVFTPKKLSF